MKHNSLKRLKGVVTAAFLAASTISTALAGCGSQSSNASEPQTALELTQQMGNGINLGNTMEAYGHAALGTNADISSYETLWQQPVTTPEMIDAMKDAGFDSLRIPVAWTNAMNYESGDYTIGKAYLDRIEEITNYALKNDMYVIINDHWDGGWWGMFGSDTEATRKEAMNMYVEMWQQIAERFKNYSSHVIFESANEELGDRLNDVDICKDSGNLTEDECYEITNKINQTFVDTIRNSGGKNKNRFLLIAGYNTDITATCDNRFQMPTDTAKDKLLVSVHYYTPWNYCGSTSVTHWGTTRDYTEQNDLLAMMTKFTEQGIGVIIGEYAVLVNEDGSIKENTDDFIENMLNNCDKYNFCPMLWDCSNLFIRSEHRFCNEDIATLFKEHSYASQSSLSKEEVQKQAEDALNTAFANAPDTFDDNIDLASLDGATAWIMFSSDDGSLAYSVGDVYNPDSKSEGIVTTDVAITEAGTYTAALDFTQTSNGCASGVGFSALAISNGELFFPNYVIHIEEIKINGETYTPSVSPYTCSDDAKCTRVNLYNEWATYNEDESRLSSDIIGEPSPLVIDRDAWKNLETMEITFSYQPMK